MLTKTSKIKMRNDSEKRGYPAGDRQISPVNRFFLCAFILYLLIFGLKSALAVEFYPQRIISLGPALTEELYLLGAEDNLVGNTIYCRRPSGASDKVKVGSAVSVDLEKIIYLQPDLVLTTPLTDRGIREKIRELGIKEFNFSQARNFHEICAQFIALGKITGREEKALEIVRQAEKQIELIQTAQNGLPRQRVFIQIGAKPLFTINKNSFINDFVEFAGAINTTRDLKSGLYSREAVVNDNPDVIIIISMGFSAEEEKKSWEKYAALKAVKNNRIYVVDSDNFCSPTPLSFVESLEKIVKILY